MYTAKLKKIAHYIHNEGLTTHFLDVCDQLIELMKLFGKNLANVQVLKFVSEHYPEAGELYRILGKTNCNRNTCLHLKSYLRDHLHTLNVNISHPGVISTEEEADLFTHAHINYSDGSILPAMSIGSNGKVYRRSVKEDLHKLTKHL
jgi:hypothetical protein